MRRQRKIFISGEASIANKIGLTRPKIREWYWWAAGGRLRSINRKEKIMAKKNGDSVYKVVELVGTSTKSWEDAAKNAVETASETLRDLRVGEIVKLDMTVDNGKVTAYRARVDVSFKIGS
jgi:dodecin